MVNQQSYSVRFSLHPERRTAAIKLPRDIISKLSTLARFLVRDNSSRSAVWPCPQVLVRPGCWICPVGRWQRRELARSPRHSAARASRDFCGNGGQFCSLLINGALSLPRQELKRSVVSATGLKSMVIRAKARHRSYGRTAQAGVPEARFSRRAVHSKRYPPETGRYH